MPKYQLVPDKYHFCDTCLERSMFFSETKILKVFISSFVEPKEVCPFNIHYILAMAWVKKASRVPIKMHANPSWVSLFNLSHVM